MIVRFTSLALVPLGVTYIIKEQICLINSDTWLTVDDFLNGPQGEVWERYKNGCTIWVAQNLRVYVKEDIRTVEARLLGQPDPEPPNRFEHVQT